MTKVYKEYSEDQISKIGNTLVYLASNIEDLTKTKALKLLYILDEISIKKYGIPFLNLSYKVWKFGPVEESIFIDLSSKPVLFKDYVSREMKEETIYLRAKSSFIDDEFSDNDIELLEDVVKKFGAKKAKELVSFTHRVNSPWYQVAFENDVLDLLNDEKINNTDLEISLGSLIDHDERKKSIYQDYIEQF